MPSRQWNILDDRTTSVSLREILLKNRGVTSKHEEDFFNPSLAQLSDPLLFHDMARAVARVKKAIKDDERIIVFGDYDVDGITGTAILVRTLLKLGARVSYRLPHRIDDGYGLKHHIIDEIASKGVKLIITVDNGISAAEQVAYARSLAIDVIITDHHSIPPHLPETVATLHPKVENEAYPFKELCGAGVAFMFARALLEASNVPNAEHVWLEMIELAALGTVADCVPLHGENRTIVHHGLRHMADTSFPGLRHLLDRAAWKRKKVDTDTIGFVIGPRLNAAGRMDTPLDALHLFLYDGDKSKLVADKLHRLNTERQLQTEGIAAQVEEYLDNDPPSSIVVAEGDWHIGIIGIVAARMVEKFGVPAIIMGRKGDELTGSCRSNGIVNIIETLRQVPQYFSHFGGHEAAAGFSMPRENFVAFKQDITDYLTKQAKDDGRQMARDIDAQLEGSDISWETCNMIEAFEPFGLGNGKPVFALSEASVCDVKTVGSTDAHLKMSVKKNGKIFDCIWFRNGSRAPSLSIGSIIDLAFSLERNEFNGSKKISLNVVDIHV